MKITPLVVLPPSDQSPVKPLGSVTILEIRADSMLMPRAVTLTELAFVKDSVTSDRRCTGAAVLLSCGLTLT